MRLCQRSVGNSVLGQFGSPRPRQKCESIERIREVCSYAGSPAGVFSAKNVDQFSEILLLLFISE